MDISKLSSLETKRFIFHPLAEEHSGKRKICAVITTVALSILSAGVFSLVLIGVNLHDRYFKKNTPPVLVAEGDVQQIPIPSPHPAIPPPPEQPPQVKPTAQAAVKEIIEPKAENAPILPPEAPPTEQPPQVEPPLPAVIEEIIEPDIEEEPITLTKLTQYLREATFGNGHFYSLKMRRECRAYHQKGDEWGNDKMIPFFLFGLYQHYVGELLGFDYNYNFEFWSAPNTDKALFKKYDREKFKKLRELLCLEPGSSIEEVTRNLQDLKLLLDKLRLNPSFQLLGAEYQRGKVRVEKQGQRAKNETFSVKDREEALTQAMKLDLLVESRQTIIFYWIKDFIVKLKSYIHENPGNLVPDNFNPSLPEFFANPEYAKLVPDVV